MSEWRRKDIKKGMCVDVAVGEDVVRGFVKRLLPRQSNPKVVEVELMSGTIGVVEHVVSKSEFEKDKFKFYNLFFHSKHIVTIWNKEENCFYIARVTNRAKKQVEETAFLFSDDSIAKEFLKELGREELVIRRISRRKEILDNFSGLDIDFFRLNEERRVSRSKLKELEEYFMRF